MLPNTFGKSSYSGNFDVDPCWNNLPLFREKLNWETHIVQHCFQTIPIIQTTENDYRIIS